MNLKKALLIIILIIFIIGIIFLISFGTIESKNKSDKLNITVTNFAIYDFAKQVGGDNVNVTFLLKPGIDAHNYEPTTKDLIKIKNSDIFLYVGGEIERWSNKVIESEDLSNTQVVCVTEMVDLLEEQEIDGAEAETEEFAYDEHVWTSPENAKRIVQEIANIFSAADIKNKEKYEENSKRYIQEISNIQGEIQGIVANKKRDRLVFGDKMPMQYFLNEFELNASAAFNGCSTETEPSSRTLTYLIEKVKEENIPVVLYIELSTGQVAKTIAKEANVETMQIQTFHNISKNDFDNGETYVSLMKRNIEVLRKALQ